MKKRILLFEFNNLLRNILVEQISNNKNFDLVEASSLNDLRWEAKNSLFDLIIMDTDQDAHNIYLIDQFIEEAQISNKILFMINSDMKQSLSFQENKKQHYFIEKPFKISTFLKKTEIVIAQILNANDETHKIGPFIFFPMRKVIIFQHQIEIELTDKEVDILKCLLNSGGETVDRVYLLKQVWDYNLDVTTHTLETHIYRLRQKLEVDSSIPRLIVSKDGGFAISEF